MKKSMFLLLLPVLLSCPPVIAQLTLQDCYTLAEQNYPLLRRTLTVNQMRELSVQNARAGRLPSVTINAQQSYQSDVTGLPTREGVEPLVPPISKNQYRAYGDIGLMLYNGGTVRAQEASIEAQANTDEQGTRVELYKLRERVNALFFGILLVNDQLTQQELVYKDIQAGLQYAQAAIANGTALRTSADILRAELLRSEQTKIELLATRRASYEMLSLLLGKDIQGESLVRPAAPEPSIDIQRPELRLYDFQQRTLDADRRKLNTAITPRLSAFFQGGVGRPGLNMLNPDPAAYYITGFRFNWDLTALYTRKRNKELLQLRSNDIEIHRETFLFNVRLQDKQQRTEIDKYRELIEADEEIISLRAKIKETASAQLQNGVIDSNDYLREVYAEGLARQSKALHETAMLQAAYTLETTHGNIP